MMITLCVLLVIGLLSYWLSYIVYIDSITFVSSHNIKHKERMSSNQEIPLTTSGGAQNATPNQSSRSQGSGNQGRRFQRSSEVHPGCYGTRFEGREPSLKGFIYDCVGERNPDQYIKTTKEITNYVGRTYTKYTGAFMMAVCDLYLADPTRPTDPDPTNVLQVELWRLAIKEHQLKVQEFKNFQAGLYNVVLGQCTEALQDMLKSNPTFTEAYQDGIALLKIIEAITYTYEENRKQSDALNMITKMFYTFKQGKHMSLQRYYELFLSQVEVLEQVGVNIAADSLIKAEAAAHDRDDLNDDDRNQARENALAIQFIRGAN